MAVDIGGDLHEGAGVYHILIEVFVMLLSLAGAGVLWGQWLRERKTAEQRSRELERVRGEAAAWMREAEKWREEARGALAGLGEAIDRQFDRWGLTAAEAEVALLVLKGLPFKEIAAIRGAAERTVRQQALMVYQKSGLSGRADLSAFFLEDLLLPSSNDPQGN